MKATLHLRVITPFTTLVDVREVAWVQVQLADGGGIGIWPGHGPLLATSVPGKLVFADASGEHSQNVGAGILSIRQNEVTVLTIDAPSAHMTLDDLDESAGIWHLQRLAQALYNGLGANLERD